MKRLLTTLMACIVLVLASFQLSSAAEPQAAIISPAANALLPNRADFPVSVTINNYRAERAANWHYWVSLANVDRQGNKINHWLKFYVRDGRYTGRVHDGSINPLPTPQRMVIILLKVDDATNQRFVAWMEDGPSTGFPGLPIVPGEIVAEQPILLP